VTRLRREVARLKMERDILKKSPGLLREGVDVKFGFVAKHRTTYSCATRGAEAAQQERHGSFAT
jgi:hypothetical protein